MEETKATTESKATEVDYKAELEKAQAEMAKWKSSFDKASTEVADYKRKERERMSEDEKRQAELQEKESYYKELERKNAIRDFADEIGYIEDSATKKAIAQLLADGDIVGALKKFGEWQKKSTEELTKKITAELMKQNPQPTAQGSSGKKTKEEIMAIKDPIERQKLIAENLGLFS